LLIESRIIFEIDKYGETTARKLKNLLFIDEGYLSRLISKLVKDGIISKISKSRFKTDKRLYILTQTDNGRELLNEINAKTDQQIETLLSPLSSVDQISIKVLIQELIDIFQKIEDN
jgi:DNA-binding MarR family transcriptional regulator